ncbi:MAG: 23S rRNA (pseudouridine(1915)-N(3))-methyltransferase RlmH [Flavobacteriales bacterium]|nr:23S rRNA (pseudouridine(1915)-N(3))-methyltransferase RlmH [Flavobacteriales bacterium]
MRIRVLFVGRTEAGAVKELVGHYHHRLGHYAQLEVVELPESRSKDVVHRRVEEEQRIMKALRPGEWIVLLDEVGRTFTSPGWARELGRLRDRGARPVFVVGGAHGVTDAVRARADLVLSLSPMTFTHQFIRPMLMEQLYRAFNILQGTGYHH